jgi:sigma-B regulation protein RsbU (phosphoserine phosphatase)
MLPHARSGLAALLLALSILPLAQAQAAQGPVFDLEQSRVQMAELKGLLRFQTGDDPDGKLGWAKPGFDDSGWKLLRLDQSTADQGFKGYSGIAWYRLQVVLPAHHAPFALHVLVTGESYQVFANGRLIGQFGSPPQQERAYQFTPSGALSTEATPGQVIPLPADIADGSGSVTIAIRFWRWSGFAFFAGPPPSITIGDASLLNDQFQLKQHHWFWLLSAHLVLLLGNLLAAFAGLGLFLLRRSEREYLWFAAVELLNAALCAFLILPVFHPVWYQPYEALHGLLFILLYGICLPMFFVTILREPRGRLFWGATASELIGALTVVPMAMGWMSWQTWIPVIYLAMIPNTVCLILLLALPARRGNHDARLLLIPFCLQFAAAEGTGLIWLIVGSGRGGSLFWSWASAWSRLFQWPFPISVQNIADFLMQISILAILVLRFARTRRDEERHASELEAARAVQQVLVPENIPAIPGFLIQSVYKPAGQVGGDFFQIIPIQSGGVLVAIGDVSGKGMPAAMTVSLLVGTLRTLAHYTQNPGEILAAMNQRMLARSHGGFTTCLVLCCDANGKLTIANAGHIAPYLGGKELPIENGLPLGLSADTTYAESSFQLAPGEQFTLLTDGVIEARDKAGALFGFERSAALSTQSAEAIACAAQAFGQDDDITALTLTYGGIAVST